jgi:hypothetical protein
MIVVLIRKLADFIDGVDLSRYRVGDVLRVPFAAARLLLAEGWAVADRRRRVSPSGHTRAKRRAADRRRRAAA